MNKGKRSIKFFYVLNFGNSLRRRVSGHKVCWMKSPIVPAGLDVH